MTANDDGLLPSRHKAGDVLADDSFSEHSASKDVADGAIWGLPHFLQLKFWGREG